MNELSRRLKTMGLVFLGLALFFTLLAFYFPEPSSQAILTLTKKEKEPFYMISGVFVAMGLFCLYRRN